MVLTMADASLAQHVDTGHGAVINCKADIYGPKVSSKLVSKAYRSAYSMPSNTPALLECCTVSHAYHKSDSLHMLAHICLTLHVTVRLCLI